MEHILAIVLGFGLGVLALSPFVPGLRPIARRIVVGSLAAISTVATAITVAGEHWKELIAEAQAERDAAAEAKANAAEAETIAIALPDK